MTSSPILLDNSGPFASRLLPSSYRPTLLLLSLRVSFSLAPICTAHYTAVSARAPSYPTRKRNGFDAAPADASVDWRCRVRDQ